MAIHHCTLKPLTYQVEQTVRLIMSWHGFHCLKVNFKGFLSKIVKKISNYDNHSEDLFKSKSLWAKKVLQTFGFPSWAKMRPRLYFIDVTVLGKKQMSQLHYIHMIHSMDHSCSMFSTYLNDCAVWDPLTHDHLWLKHSSESK